MEKMSGTGRRQRGRGRGAKSLAVGREPGCVREIEDPTGELTPPARGGEGGREGREE